MKAPNWVRDVFEHYLICEFTSIDNGKPVTFPLLFFYNDNPPKFAVTSSILFSRKIEHMKKNPKVSLLFSNPEGSGIEKQVVLVQGIAKCDDSDLDHGWERYLPMWRKKEPYIDGFNVRDRKSTRLNSSHRTISYAVFCLKKQNYDAQTQPRPGNRLR